MNTKNILYEQHTREETAKKFNITHKNVDEITKKCLKVLESVRSKRPPPHRDEKIITSWNGLMISAFVKASIYLDNQEYLDYALGAAKFIQLQMYNDKTGQLLRNYCQGSPNTLGFCDDYSFMIQGVIVNLTCSSIGYLRMHSAGLGHRMGI